MKIRQTSNAPTRTACTAAGTKENESVAEEEEPSHLSGKEMGKVAMTSRFDLNFLTNGAGEKQNK